MIFNIKYHICLFFKCIGYILSKDFKMIRTEKNRQKGQILFLYMKWILFCQSTILVLLPFKYPRELEFKLKHNIDKDLYLYVNIGNDGQDNALDDFIL